MPRLLALTVLSLLSTASPAATLAAHLAIVDANSGSGTVQLTATEPWTATASDTWLTVTPASGTASELLTYTFTANPGPNGRMAALNINGQTFTVVQPSSTSLFTPWGPSVKGRIRTLAGNDGQLRSPRGIAVDANGNVYIADTSNHRVCKLSASSNTLSTVAGTGAPGFSGDNGPATAAQLNTPTALTVDPAGNLYIADSGNLRVRRLDAQTGILSTTAGNGVAAYTGDGGPALSAGFLSVHSLALDPSGNLFIADSANHRIRRLDAATGHISTAAGTGVAGFSGDDALATAAQLNAPNHLAFDPLGNNLYIGDSGNALIRRVDAATGLITTVSTPQSDTSSFAAGPDGTLFVLRSGVINKLNIATGTATPIPATAPISNVHAVAVDGAGNLYLAADTIYVVDFTSPTHTLTPTFPLGDQSFTLTTLTQDGLRPAAGSAPALLSAAPAFPANIVNAIQTFNVTARDLDGASNIARFYFLIAPTPVISTNGCHGFFDRALNAVFLYDDALSTLSSLANSQCAVNGFSTTSSGTDFTLTLLLTRKIPVASKLHVWITDLDNNGTGWLPIATWRNPPVLISSAPAAASGGIQTFTMTAGDLDGSTNISRVYFLVSTTASVTLNACHGFYDRDANAVYLYNNTLTDTSSLSNSQCLVNGFSVVISPTNFSFTLTLTNRTSITKNVYAWISDYEGNGTGWLRISTWAPPSLTHPPALIVAGPERTSAATQRFYISTRHPDGYTNLSRIYFLVNPTPAIPQNTCHGFYDRVLNAVYLYNDSLTNLTSLANSQCAVQGFITSAGSTDLTLELTLTKTSSTSAIVYVWLTGKDGNGTGWLPISSWTGTVLPPTIASTSPVTATAAQQRFTISTRSSAGYTNINRLYFLVNSDPTIPANTCHGFYDRALNAFYLYNDALTVLQGPLVPGSNSQLQNSQCAIDGPTSGLLYVTGTDLTLYLGILRKNTATNQNLYLWLTDNLGSGTGWRQSAAWPAIGFTNQPPSFVSATPATATGLIENFQFILRDPNGTADIRRVYFLVNSTANIQTNTCHGFYDRGANTFYLYNNDLTALTTSGNSQCAILANQSAANPSGTTDLTLQLALQRKGLFATGTQTVYLWTTDAANAGTGWIPAATWLP